MRRIHFRDRIWWSPGPSSWPYCTQAPLREPYQAETLPPNLRSFTFGSEIPSDDPSILCGFSPKGSLRLSANIKPVESSDPTQHALSRSYITDLTPSPTRTWGHSSFKLFPRTLRKLVFDGPLHLVTQELAHLPPNLEHLEIPSYKLEEQKPLWLTFLDANPPILGCELAKLPPKLTTLIAYFREATLAQIRQLPRTLRTLDLKGYNRSTFARSSLLTYPHIMALVSVYHPFWRIWETSESGNAAASAVGYIPPYCSAGGTQLIRVLQATPKTELDIDPRVTLRFSYKE